MGKFALDASGGGPPYGHWTRAGRLQRCFLALELGHLDQFTAFRAYTVTKALSFCPISCGLLLEKGFGIDQALISLVLCLCVCCLSLPPVAHQADYLSGFVNVLSSCQRQGKGIWDHVGWYRLELIFVLFSPVAHAVHRHTSGYAGARCHPSGAVFHL